MTLRSLPSHGRRSPRCRRTSVGWAGRFRGRLHSVSTSTPTSASRSSRSNIILSLVNGCSHAAISERRRLQGPDDFRPALPATLQRTARRSSPRGSTHRWCTREVPSGLTIAVRGSAVCLFQWLFGMPAAGTYDPCDFFRSGSVAPTHLSHEPIVTSAVCNFDSAGQLGCSGASGGDRHASIQFLGGAHCERTRESHRDAVRAGRSALRLRTDGRLRVIKNGALLASPFLTLTVASAGERGLLGVAFDPNFATNRYRVRVLHRGHAHCSQPHQSVHRQR